MSSQQGLTLFARQMPTFQVQITSLSITGVGKWTINNFGIACNLPFQVTVAGAAMDTLLCTATEGSYVINEVIVDHSAKTFQVQPGSLPSASFAWMDLGYPEGGAPALAALSVHGQLTCQMADAKSLLDPQSLDVSVTGNATLNLPDTPTNLFNVVTATVNCTGKSTAYTAFQCQTLTATVWGSSVLQGVLVTDSATITARGVSSARVFALPSATVNAIYTGKSTVSVATAAQNT